MTIFILSLVVLVVAVAFWIHHRTLKGVVSDVKDIGKDVSAVKAAVTPAAPVVPVITTVEK